MDALVTLIGELGAQRDKDATAVRDALPLVIKRANEVQLEGAPKAERFAREVYCMRKLAAQEAQLSLDFLFCLLISTHCIDDMRASNPFVPLCAFSACALRCDA